MLERIWTLIKKDLVTSTRDNLLLYITLAPILYAVAIVFIIPLTQDPQIPFALAEGLDPAVVEAFEQRGKVEIFADRAAVIERVEELDAVAGVVPGDAHPEVIVEGNEPESVKRLPGLILDQLATPNAPTVTFESLGEEDLPIEALALTAMLFLVISLAGFTAGFIMLHDKETHAISAFNITPLSFTDYLLSKGTTILVQTLGVGIICVVLMQGTNFDPLLLLIATLGGLPTGILLGVLLGTLANDQLSAITYIKGLSMVFGSLPLAGFIVDAPWTYFFYPMCNYWAVRACYAASTGDAADTYFSAGLAIATALPVLAIALWFMRKRLGFSTQA